MSAPAPFPDRTEPPAAPATAVIAVRDLAAALPFDALFDPSRPLEVDVGCGHGRFLLARAAARPDRQFLGIDRMPTRIRKVDRQVRRAGLTNVRLLRLEAFYSLRFLLPPHCVSVFHIYFPDPWPKRRHHRRRLFNEVFPDVLWSRLVPGGSVQVATDHPDYFAEIRRRLAGDPRFREVAPVPRSPAEYTDFEAACRGRGTPFGECAFSTLPAPSRPCASP